uniref:Uncharacterized protein n=1 Tax=Strigamia maritima TaxID=126957 RepID=T1JE37_STRMM
MARFPELQIMDYDVLTFDLTTHLHESSCCNVLEKLELIFVTFYMRQKKKFMLDWILSLGGHHHRLILKIYAECGTIFTSVSSAIDESARKTTRSYNKAKADPPARPNSYSEDSQLQPVFDNTTSRNVTTQLGITAYLPCNVKNLGGRTSV